MRKTSPNLLLEGRVDTVYWCVLFYIWFPHTPTAPVQVQPKKWTIPRCLRHITHASPPFHVQSPTSINFMQSFSINWGQVTIISNPYHQPTRVKFCMGSSQKSPSTHVKITHLPSSNQASLGQFPINPSPYFPPPQIIKTRVRLQFWKNWGWPIWFLIDGL